MRLDDEIQALKSQTPDSDSSPMNIFSNSLAESVAALQHSISAVSVVNKDVWTDTSQEYEKFHHSLTTKLQTLVFSNYPPNPFGLTEIQQWRNAQIFVKKKW